jgi:hypothetical protein
MPTSTLRTKLILAFTILMLGFSINPAEAAKPNQTLTMSVEPAYQGYFKYGEWLPVWVNLENNGSNLEGEVRVSITQDFQQITYAAPVSLANGARKRLPVYVLPNNFTHEVKVDFVAGEETLQSERVVVQPQPNINYLIGIAANERGAFFLLPSIRLPSGRQPVVIDVDLATLPERPEGLRSLDCLILNDIDSSSLTPEQASALSAWVQQGGRLVIGGGAGAIQTTSGLPTEMLPLHPNGLTDLDQLDAFAEFAQTSPVRVPGPFVVATGGNEQGQTLAEQNGLPLVQEISFGDGYITLVALDLSASPFDAWTGTPSFWETILTPGAVYPNWMPPDMSMRQIASGPISNALSNLPSLDLPSAKSLAILLIVYIVVVGPINYVILRWRKKLHWAWVTIPLITILFAGLSFGIGYAKRGTDLIVNKIAIIEGQPNGSAQISSYIGLFSPANQGYEIEVSGQSLLSPMSTYYDPWSGGSGGGNNLTFVQSNPSLMRGLTVNQWSMQSFMTENNLEGIGQLNADLQLENGYLVGTVTNATNSLMKDVILVLRPNYARLGDLESGASARVNLKLDSLQDMMYGPSMSWKIYEDQYAQPLVGPPSRELEFKRTVLEAVLDQQYYYGSRFTPGETHSAKELDLQPTVTLLGWMDTAPPDVRVNGEIPQVAENALYILESHYKISESGKFIIPAGLIPGVVAQMPNNGGTCGSGNTSIWIDSGEAVFEYIVPPELVNSSFEALQFALQTDSGISNPPQVEIYNWIEANWNLLDKPIMGLNMIPGPTDYVSPEGLIRFRLSVENQNFQGGACFYTALGLEGSR